MHCAYVLHTSYAVYVLSLYLRVVSPGRCSLGVSLRRSRGGPNATSSRCVEGAGVFCAENMGSPPNRYIMLGKRSMKHNLNLLAWVTGLDVANQWIIHPCGTLTYCLKRTSRQKSEPYEMYQQRIQKPFSISYFLCTKRWPSMAWTWILVLELCESGSSAPPNQRGVKGN